MNLGHLSVNADGVSGQFTRSPWSLHVGPGGASGGTEASHTVLFFLRNSCRISWFSFQNCQAQTIKEKGNLGFHWFILSRGSVSPTFHSSRLKSTQIPGTSPEQLAAYLKLHPPHKSYVVISHCSEDLCWSSCWLHSSSVFSFSFSSFEVKIFL